MENMENLTEQNEEVLEEVVEEPTEETVEEIAEETAEEVSREELLESVMEALGEEPVKKAKKGVSTGLIVTIVVAVFMIVAALFVRMGLRKDAGIAIDAHHTNAMGYPSWSIHYETKEDGNLAYYYLDENAVRQDVTADEVMLKMNDVVATCGDMELTNQHLQYFYQDQVYAFTSQYASYISYMMDTSAPLDAQMSMTGNGTWQQNFLEGAVKQFNQVASMYQKAQEAGFTLSAEDQEYITSMTDLDTMGMMYGFPDGESFIKVQMGAYASVESYKDYMNKLYTASVYMSELAEQIEIEDSEVEAYYDENQTTLMNNYGMEKIDKNVVNVRHILIAPESTTAEDGTSSISDEAWPEAEAEAQRILDEWKAGEATEDTFAKLAEENTDDPGSAYSGGLYENVYPKQMMQEFNDWCFDDARQTGDTEIVKTSYGYHIMYFVSEGDYVYWFKTCKDQLLAEKAAQMSEEMINEFETTSDLSKAIISDALAPADPNAVEEPETTTDAPVDETIVVPAE